MSCQAGELITEPVATRSMAMVSIRYWVLFMPTLLGRKLINTWLGRGKGKINQKVF